MGWQVRIRRRAMLPLVCLGVMGSLASQAQQMRADQGKPDFSGRWVLESTADTAPDVPRSVEMRWEGLTSTTARGEPMQPYFKRIVVMRELASGIASESREMGIIGGVVGGRPMDGRAGGGSWTTYATKWEGSMLIFENSQGSGRTHDDPPWTDRRETWSLEDGRLKIVITTSSSETATRSVTSFYHRP